MNNKRIVGSVLLSIFLFIIAPQSEALTIDFSNEFSCGNLKTPKIWGCYTYDTEKIDIYNKLDMITMSSVILHELGHYYTIDKNLSLFDNYEMKERYETGNSKEKAAETFKKYIYKREMGLVISKPYIRYINNFDVFEYRTGRKIEFEEAMKNNIWDDIQELPFFQKIITQEQEVFFDNLRI